MDTTLEIRGSAYTLIHRQRANPISTLGVYKGDSTYLRIGPKYVLERMLRLHKKMASYGFPVAPLVHTGTHAGKPYFIEKSLGDKNFTTLFFEDIEKTGSISDTHFRQFLSVVESFVNAQTQTVLPTHEAEAFSVGIRLDVLCAELPEYADAIRNHLERILERRAYMPYVFTHGDLNPTNMYPHGIIDLEDSFAAPLGFDIVSAITTTNWFPTSRSYESFRRYHFSKEQIEEYLDRCDAILVKNGFPAVSPATADFEFCRAVWLTSRMHMWPRMQKFRYERFIKNYFSSGLAFSQAAL